MNMQVRRGEKGFTLIELLIVVAILGVLAAVVIPNVGRFLGKGKTEANATELTTVQSAVSAMMVDQGYATLAAPGVHPGIGNMTAINAGTATGDMSLFPDSTLTGTHLFNHGDAGVAGGQPPVSYVQTGNTTNQYWVDNTGTVHQIVP